MLRVTGIILAGGYSRRMGCDKALLELGGKPIIVRIAAELAEITDRVLIACGEKERQAYSFLRLPQVTDRYPGCGPLAGLHATMSRSEAEWSFAVACDLPFASAEFMRYMLGELEQAEWQSSGGNGGSAAGPRAVVPVAVSGKVQPLLGLYHKSVLPSLAAALAKQQFRVMEWLESLNVLYVSQAGFPGGQREQAAMLLNMNTPENYLAAVKLEERS